MRFRISKRKYDNWRSGISNGRTKPKFASSRNQILVFQIKKKIPKISQILQFRKSSNFHYRQTHKIIKFSKLLNFKNWQIFKI